MTRLAEEFKNNIKLKLAKILIMGFSFKENCQDIRNTRVIDIVHSLKKRNCLGDIVMPQKIFSQ